MFSKIESTDYKKLPFYTALLSLVLPLFYNQGLEVYYATSNLLPLLLVTYLTFSNYKFSLSEQPTLTWLQNKLYWLIAIIFVLLMHNHNFWGEYYFLDFITLDFREALNYDYDHIIEWAGIDGYGFFHGSAIHLKDNVFPDVGFYFLLISLFMPMFLSRNHKK